MAGYSPISDILSFGKSKKYSDRIMSNIINIDLTEDKKGIRFTTQDGVSFTVFFPYTLHEHSNLDILERINVDENGKLTFDGKSIEGDIFIKDDYYNKAEIDNRITSIVKGMSWKENVSTKTELENLENNSKGDARIVDEESNIYVFNGESWDKVGSSINIPNATSENDGLLSKEYFIKINKLDDDFVKNTEYNTLKRDIIAEQTELLTEDKTIKGSINEILNSVNNNVSSIINVEKNINDLFLVKDEFNSIIEKESVSFKNEFIDGNIDIQTGELIDNKENIKYVRNKSTIAIGKESLISLQYSKENDLFADVIVFAYTNENYIGNAELNMTTDDIDKYYNILLPENTNIIKIVFKIADERIQSDYVTLANSIDIKLNKLYIKEYNIKRFDNLNTSIKDLQTVVKSKNLFDGHFEKGYLSKLDGSKIDITKNKCARTKYFIAIDDSIENVTMQRVDEQNLISNTLALAYDSEFKFIKQLELKRSSIDNKLCHNINLTNDIKYIKVALIIPNDKIGDDYLDYFNSINFQIENGLEATEYEPHKLFVKKDKIEGFNDLEEKVNELFTSVSNGKNLLETAITDKGGVVSKSGDIATFDELKSGIDNIPIPISNCKLNIFTQSTEPITKQGLWLKTDNTYDKIEDFNNTKFDSFKYTVNNNGYVKQYTKCVKVGKNAYLIGGDHVTSRNLRYDLETNQTATMTSIPSDYYSSSSSAANFCCSDNINKIFLIQCGTNNYKSAQYNIDTNTYTALGFSEVTYRRDGDSCYYKNKIYCFSISSNYNYIYNLDTTTVTNMTSININKPKIVLIDDNVYLISDYNSSGNCYKYNLTTGTVTTLTTSPLKARTDSLTVYNHGNYIYQCSPSSAIGESPAKLAIVRYDILNNKHERIMETVGTSDAGSHYCGVIYNNKLLLFYSSRTYYIDFILNKNCLYLDKSDNTNNVLLVETPYELLNKKETFKSCFLTNNNSESISCDIYTGNGTSWNKI